MSGEFPEPERSFWVHETHTLDRGKRMTVFVAGPFDDPDDARQVCAAMKAAEPNRMLTAVEHGVLE